MDTKIVTVVGASGSLGGQIVKALIEKGAHVRAMVRATSNRAKLEALGVTDFVVADLNDPASLHRAMTAEPRAVAIVASAAGFSAHSAKTKGDNSKTDTEGYRKLIDAAKAADARRFILISILECDEAFGVPHFYQKFETEQYLAEKGQPYLALRAGAFLDRSRDVVPASIRKGVFPDILPGAHGAGLFPRPREMHGAGGPRSAGLGDESERGHRLRRPGHRHDGGGCLRPGPRQADRRQARFSTHTVRDDAAARAHHPAPARQHRRDVVVTKGRLRQPRHPEAEDGFW